eukprot:gnl/Chilomastix_caulleri/1741.p2 GENE.gnl/Chilomastix_caulleri/1741~~gnl/Chilomastix_caulleri/1741.p2  ORF type:complete len:139 (+),score=30.62 gnl/Chilomastix_caulleri/1741:124-540(+)
MNTTSPSICALSFLVYWMCRGCTDPEEPPFGELTKEIRTLIHELSATPGISEQANQALIMAKTVMDSRVNEEREAEKAAPTFEGELEGLRAVAQKSLDELTNPKDVSSILESNRLRGSATQKQSVSSTRKERDDGTME